MISLSGNAGFNMANEMRRVAIAAFSEMHFVTDPSHPALLTIANFLIIRGIDKIFGTGDFFSRAPTQTLHLFLKILLPNLFQDLHLRKLFEPRELLALLNGIQQSLPIQANKLGIGHPLLALFRK